jgi:hypothetical protein
MCLLGVLDALQKVFTILAIIVGGIWACFHYRRGRTYRSRLEPSVSAQVICRGSEKYVLSKVRLKNVGLSKVDIEQKGSALRVFVYSTVAKPPKARSVAATRLATFPVFEDQKWIEPGETIEEERLIVVPPEGEVAFRLELRLVANKAAWTSVKIIRSPSA